MEAHVVAPHGLEQRERALDVGAHEGRGVRDGVVVMGLGRKVDDRIRARDQPIYQRGVADIAHDELRARALDVLAPPRVSERVEHRHPHLGMLARDPPHERGPDEPASAGNQEIPHIRPAVLR